MVPKATNLRTAAIIWWSESEGLAKSLLRFEVLIAVPFVKGVGSFADDVRAHGHAFTSFGVRPFFGRFEQFRAGAVAALTVGHDQSIYFRAPRDFQKRSDAHVNPTDDEFVHFGEEDGMLRRLELCEPCFYFLRCCGIAEFAA